MLALNSDVLSQGYRMVQENEPSAEEKASRQEFDRNSEPHDSLNYLDWASNLLENSNDFMEAFDFSENKRKKEVRTDPLAQPQLGQDGLGQILRNSPDKISQDSPAQLNRDSPAQLNQDSMGPLNHDSQNHLVRHGQLHQTHAGHQTHSGYQSVQSHPIHSVQGVRGVGGTSASLHGLNPHHELQLLQPGAHMNMQPPLPGTVVPLPKEIAARTPDAHLPQHVHPLGRLQLPWDGRTGGIRSKRPCDHCRRRKTKCVVVPGAKNCVQCETKSLLCTYLPGKMDDESAAKRLRPAGASPLDLQYRTPNMDIVPPNVPIREVAPVQDYSMMSKSLLKKTLSLQFPRLSYYVGPTSYLYDTNILDVIIDAQNKPSGTYSPNVAASSKIQQVNLTDSISLRKVGSNTQFILKDDQSKQSFLDMSNEVDAIEKFVAPHGQILIDLYFRIIHPSYPILHKKVFLEKYSRTHREFSAPVLAAVYVLAIQWWDYDPQLNRFPKPNVRLILKIALNNYMLEILKRPKLSAVQGGLLLLQCKHILSDFGALDSLLSWTFSDCGYNDWVLCSQILALAEELGLGLDCDQWKLPKWERGLRKRLSWAVFMEHHWLALKDARPSHIDSNNWEVLPLIEEDFPEKHGDGDLKEGSADINNGKKNFTNLILLSQILAEIITSFYSMRAMRELTEVEDVLRIAKPIQLRLRNWYHSLPVELQMNSVQPRKLCPNGYLQLAYFATELTLHRKIITVLHQLAVSGKSVPNEISDVCRAAAKTRLTASVEFVRDLKPEHIHSFWHSSSSENFTLIGTFAALLFASSPSKQEADYYRDQIFNYRWILKISSKGFVQVGDALRKLDLVLNHIPGLLNENVEQPMVAPNVPTIDYSKVYQQHQMLQSLPLSQALVDSTHLAPASTKSNQFGNRHGFSPSNSQFSGSNLANHTSINTNGISRSNANRIHDKTESPGTAGNVDDAKRLRKIPEISPQSSTLQYRTSGLSNSPYASPQTSTLTSFPASSNTGSRGNQTGATLSPKEIIRQQNPMHVSETRSENLDRRTSVASHTSDAFSNRDSHSSKTNSPLMMRSPLSHQQNPQQISKNNHTEA